MDLVQFADGAVQRGLRDADGTRRCGEATLVGQRQQGAQMGTSH